MARLAEIRRFATDTTREQRLYDRRLVGARWQHWSCHEASAELLPKLIGRFPGHTFVLREKCWVELPDRKPEHTWIEMDGDTIIDPTTMQFGFSGRHLRIYKYDKAPAPYHPTPWASREGRVLPASA